MKIGAKTLWSIMLAITLASAATWLMQTWQAPTLATPLTTLPRKPAPPVDTVTPISLPIANVPTDELTDKTVTPRESAHPLTAAERQAYLKAIQRTTSMVGDAQAQSLAQKMGLDILNLTWEDTGRYKDSSVGPNISDMTIQVAAPKDPNSKEDNTQISCMPVVRYPNFSDKTCDLNPQDFTLLVGNQQGKALKRISLYDFLAQPTAYLSQPSSWKASKKSLLALRDSKVLVSAQACFLPVPKQGKAEFNPVLFNYVSSKNNPAVLTILATREGTSVTIIDNQRDAFSNGFSWGQRLFHNDNGQRASLTGQRESDFIAQGTTQTPTVGGKQQPEAGLNMVLLIQVPLKYKEPVYNNIEDKEYEMAPTAKSEPRRRAGSDVENAVIGHGKVEGPFTEIDNLEIERDDRFPVRVTVQFYKATSNGIVSAADLQAIKNQIDRVYANSDYVGSLVTEGQTNRITEYEGAKVEPADWWEHFWQRYEQNFGRSRQEAVNQLRKLLGNKFQEQPVTELYLRSLLKTKV